MRGSRFQTYEEEFINTLRNLFKIQIIIVYTNSIIKNMALQMKECIKSRIKDVDFIEILALPVKIQSSYIQSYNLDKLIEKTIKNVKEN